eukprot:GHVQ01011501.1.p1 GENE.GHVQ01011501.1~~GHVQ01011501.1.p1  ORF type:complete len:1649 (-),score=188.89 GHVQ01011501.1:523-5469(-)
MTFTSSIGLCSPKASFSEGVIPGKESDRFAQQIFGGGRDGTNKALKSPGSLEASVGAESTECTGDDAPSLSRFLAGSPNIPFDLLSRRSLLEDAGEHHHEDITDKVERNSAEGDESIYCKSFFGDWKHRLVESIRRLFGQYVLIVFRYSWLFVVLSAALCLALGTGFLYRKGVDTAERQYALQDSIAQRDSDKFNRLFANNLVRPELVIVESRTGENIITKEFLDKLWTFHQGVLNLTVTVGDGVTDNANYPEEHIFPIELSSTFPAAITRRRLQDDFADDLPFTSGRGGRGAFGFSGDDDMFDDFEVDGRGSFGRPFGGYLDEELYHSGPLFDEGGTSGLSDQCNPLDAPPKDQVTGLACQESLEPNSWGFSNLCSKDAEGVCMPPKGVIFMYDDREEYGNSLEYPEHKTRKLHDKYITDMWISPESILVERESDKVVGGSSFLLKYSIADEPDKSEAAHLWEQAFMDYVVNYSEIPEAQFYVKTDKSLRDELSASTQIKNSDDFFVIGATALLLFGYIAVMNFSMDLYRMKSLPAVMGGVAACLGYVGGVGLCYLCGLEHTNTASATPFLVLGVGVDDMFVIMNSYTLTFTHTVAKDRLRVAMQDCGLSITITTLTNLVAFIIGASSPYLAIRNFCIFTAIGLFMGYVMALTFFLGWLCIDARREEQRRLFYCGKDPCCFPWGRRSSILPVQDDTPRTDQLRKLSSSTFKLVALQAAASDKRVVPKFPSGSCCADLENSISSVACSPEYSKRCMRHIGKTDSAAARRMAEANRRSTKFESGALSLLDDNGPSSRWPTAASMRANSRVCGRRMFSEKSGEVGSPSTEGTAENTAKASEAKSVGFDAQLECCDVGCLEPPSLFFKEQVSSYSTTSGGTEGNAAKEISLESDYNTVSQAEVDGKSVIFTDGSTVGVELSSCHKPSEFTVEACKSDLEFRTPSNIERNPVYSFDPTIGSAYPRGIPSMSDSQLLHDLTGYSRGPLIRELSFTDKYMNIDRQVSHLYADSAGEFVRASRKMSMDPTDGRELYDHNSALGVSPQWTAEELAEPIGNVGRKWRIAFLSYYGWFITRPIVKLLVLILFGIYLSVAIYGCTNLQRGLDVKKLASDDSYLAAFFKNQENNFAKYGEPVSVFFSEAQKWYSPAYQEAHALLHEHLVNAWYTLEMKDGMADFLDSPLGQDLPENDPKFSTDMLAAWLNTPKGASFTKDFVWKDGNLKSWKLTIVPPFLSSSEEQGKFMDSIRHDMDIVSLAGRPFSSMFIFYESDRDILQNTLTNMAFAAAAMMLVSLLLLSSLWSGVLVIITLTMIDTGVVGFMYYWDLPLNMLTMVNLIISIGFAVDYSAHMCHTFGHCVGKTRNLRVIETLVLMGNPVFHGAFSTQLGVLMLAFSSSYILRVFFKMMTLVLVLGMCHGVIFLPVLLSLVGPMTGVHSDETVAMSLRGFFAGLKSFFCNCFHRCSKRTSSCSVKHQTQPRIQHPSFNGGTKQNTVSETVDSLSTVQDVIRPQHSAGVSLPPLSSLTDKAQSESKCVEVTQRNHSQRSLSLRRSISSPNFEYTADSFDSSVMPDCEQEFFVDTAADLALESTENEIPAETGGSDIRVVAVRIADQERKTQEKKEDWSAITRNDSERGTQPTPILTYHYGIGESTCEN